jgi:HK97 gp10 family phage protein
MAKVDIKMPEEFLKQISRVGNDFDRIAESVLESGGEIVLAKTKSNLSSVIGKGNKYESRSTGQLEAALGMTPVKMDRRGDHNIKIGFSEPRSDGTSNAKIANIIEYGQHNQPAKPFLKPAGRASKSECISTMQKKFEEEVKRR